MADDYGLFRDAWHPDNTVAVRMGCVRIEPGVHDTSDPDFITNPGLYIHNNSAHVSVGLVEVKIEKSTGRIRIVTDGSEMGSVFIDEDETCVKRDVSFGATGGNGYASLNCTKLAVPKDLRIQSVYDEVAHADQNIWVLFVSPLERGVGLPSKADEALALIAALTERVAILEGA